mgnify:CR=1 FL=1
MYPGYLDCLIQISGYFFAENSVISCVGILKIHIRLFISVYINVYITIAEKYDLNRKI